MNQLHMICHSASPYACRDLPRLALQAAGCRYAVGRGLLLRFSNSVELSE